MILGVYWFYEFPNKLYEFEFFKFKKGLGGLGSSPAELLTTIRCQNSDNLILQLQYLIDKYNDGKLFIYSKDNYLKISIGGWEIFDYDFLITKKVEKILQEQKTILVKDYDFRDCEIIKLTGKMADRQGAYFERKFLQIVGSEIGKNQSERLAVRMDCNIIDLEKNNFMVELVNIARAENINVLYHYEKPFQNRVNLMIFFSNGRQGINLYKKQDVNLFCLENKLDILFQKYDIKIGHIGGFEYYPYSSKEEKIELMVDKDYFLG
ncbi:MAG: hypothetical protein LBJ63_08585 [Prevotellaceae bacterium]|jgi:hypothetical protein|nr:hypothetical protein [Prevotellaceae bacterium]